MNMKLRFLTFLLSFAFLAGAVVAHGDLKHIRGTVEKMTSNSVTVKTTSGASVEVKLVASTMFVMRSAGTDKPAKLGDLAVGDRVVIHAKPNGDTFEAVEVRFSASPVAAAAGAKPKP